MCICKSDMIYKHHSEAIFIHLLLFHVNSYRASTPAATSKILKDIVDIYLMVYFI